MLLEITKNRQEKFMIEKSEERSAGLKLFITSEGMSSNAQANGLTLARSTECSSTEGRGKVE